MAENQGVFQQANSLWKILDELAESNPEGYNKFIAKMLKDNKDWLKPPEPVFCFRTKKLPESSNHHFFINICKWDQVPAPSDEADRISVIPGEIRDLPDCSTQHSVIDICFHTKILNETVNITHSRKIIASMALEYVEKQAGFKLSKAYKVLAIKYKGDEKELTKFFFRTGLAKKTAEKPADNPQPSVLHGLSKIVQQKAEHKTSGSHPSDLNVQKNGDKGNPGTTKKPLIEEISPKRVAVSTQPPKYSVEVVAAGSDRPRSIVVLVDLPNVKSGVECELDVSKDDLLLSSPHRGKLLLQLPEEGNEDETTSTFNKTTHQLTVTIPVLTE